ncbi:MAG TPA: class I SAM-dependent methyltransferase [Caldilineae bacterium]|nr:class I SAM-dependent methyltransferase [Caldilineae bacterium]
MPSPFKRLFSRLPMARSTRAYDFALAQVDLNQAERVLEIGAGQGYGAAHLSRVLPHAQLFSVDISLECLKPEQLESGPKPPIFIQATAPALPLAAASMDAVILVMTFHCLPEPQQVFHEAARVLKPDGALILADVDGHHWMARPFEWVEHAFISPLTHAYTPEELAQLAAHAGLRDFRVVRRPGKEKGFMMWAFAAKRPPSP